MSVKLDTKVKCRISGFTGIAVGRAKYVTGCIYIKVQPKAGKDNKMPEAVWISEQFLCTTSKAKRGGPQNHHSIQHEHHDL